MLAVGTDHLILRHGERTFWRAGRCDRCGTEVAMPDLDAHYRTCDGKVADSPIRPQPSKEGSRRAPSSAVDNRRAQPESVEREITGRQNLAFVDRTGVAQAGSDLVTDPAAQLPDTPSSARPARPSPLARLRPGPRRRTTRPLAASAVVVVVLAVVVAAAIAMQRIPETTPLRPPQEQATPSTTDHPVPERSPTSGPVSQSDQIALQQRAFDARRQKLTQELRQQLDQATITSVDRLEFDPAGPVIVARVTSPLTSTPSLLDAAWAVTRSMLVLWEPATMKAVPTAVPRFRLTLSGVEIECPPGVMFQLGQGSSRGLWESGCSGAR